MKSKVIPGINIQWPWSQLIVDKKKAIETRTYKIPEKFKDVELAIIETPGPHGRKKGILKARIIGTVTFEESFQYNKSSWEKDFKSHLVDTNDPQFAWNNLKERWGWKIKRVRKFKQPLEAPKKKGIIFATECLIN